MITFDELIKEHERLWGDTTCEQQVAKWDEEKKEYQQTKLGSEEELFELADMIIVSAGIARFDYALGLWRLHETMSQAYKYEVIDLLEAVEKKMEKNRNRKWEKKSDVGYHHIGD